MKDAVRDWALLRQADSQEKTAKQMQAQTEIQVAQHNLAIEQKRLESRIVNIRRFLTEQEYNAQRIKKLSENYPAYARFSLRFIQHNISHRKLENRFRDTEDLRYLNEIKLLIQEEIDSLPRDTQILSETSVLRGELDFRLQSGNIEENYAKWESLSDTHEDTLRALEYHKSQLKKAQKNYSILLLLALPLTIWLFFSPDKDAAWRGLSAYFLGLPVCILALVQIIHASQPTAEMDALKQRISLKAELGNGMAERLDKMGLSNYNEYLEQKARWTSARGEIKTPIERIVVEGVLL